MKPSAFVALVVMLGPAVAPAQDGARVPIHPLLAAAEPPAGLEPTTVELRDGAKVLGDMVVFSKAGQVSKVVVRIEKRGLAATPARRAATKGYVNGFVSALAEAGFKVVEAKVPDLAKESFETAIPVGIVVANAEGKKLWTHQEIFFTDVGFAVQVIAEDPETLAALTRWARTIKPKAGP